MRILALLGKVLLWIIGCFIGLLLLINLFVPIYDFDEPHAFSGSYLHNPYEGIDSTTWLRCNFHAHTRTAGGIANGRDNSNELVDSIYHCLGFDHAGISNYNSINTYGNTRQDYIPAYEHGYGIFKIHQICLGAQKVRRIDYPFWQTLSMKQHTLNKIGENCTFAIPAHPCFVKGGYFAEDFKYLDNYRLLEVLNGYCNSTAYWDTALSYGHLVYLIAGDDSHHVSNIYDPACRFTLINAPTNDSDHLLAALGAGKAVGIVFHGTNIDETHQQKGERLKTDLPRINHVRLLGDTLRIAADRVIAKAEFIGQGGRILQTETNVEEATYIIQKDDNYVRTVLSFADNTEVWLNPITRHQNADTLYHPRLDHLNYWKTALCWLTYTAIIAFIILFFIKKKKSKKTETKN